MTAVSTVVTATTPPEVTETELPTDHPRAAARAPRAAVEELTLSELDRARLEDLCAWFDAGSATVVLAVFALALERHTGERLLLVGIGDDTGKAVAPVRIDIDPDSSFAELLRDSSETLRELPRPACVAALPPGWTGAAADVDVTLALAGAALRLTYNTSLFAASTAAQLLADCAALLTRALGEPLVPARRLRMRGEPAPPPPWSLPVPNGFVPPEPPTATETLVDRFQAVVAEHGDRVAVRGPSGRYRYAELDRETTTLARRIGAPAGRDHRLGLLCAHDAGLAVAVWSALKAGYAYVPLDPRLPADRLARIVADSGVAAIACDPELAPRARRLARGRPVVPLGGSAGTAAAAEPPEISADAPAYLLYTSGTTGSPKAVSQSHRNVLANALAYADRVRICAGDQVPLLAGFSFDAAVMDLFGALLTGATLTVVDPLVPASRLRAGLAEIDASILHCTPTLFRHLLSDVDDAAGRLGELSGVSRVVLGGEQVVRNDLRAFFRHFPDGCSLVNGLGPTECTVALQHMVTRADLAGPGVPVGFPIGGVDIRLLDVDGQPAEVVGELEITGAHVGLGYWNQPELTASVFRRHADGRRSYRTGDLARRRADGALVYFGRTDRQVKIRGHRVEPAEVEAVLRAHPSVAQSAVVVDRRSGDPRLIGYVTSATGRPADERELAGYLGRQVPDYAVPFRIVPLDDMPLGPTGKLDRTRLPAPEEATAVDDQPWTSLERRVADIWCEVLGLTRTDRSATFLASGGDSVRLLAMLAKVRDEFGVEIELVDFLAVPTIPTVAALIEKDRP